MLTGSSIMAYNHEFIDDHEDKQKSQPQEELICSLLR